MPELFLDKIHCMCIFYSVFRRSEYAMLYRYIVCMHSNTHVFYIRIEILLTDINYMYYLYCICM